MMAAAASLARRQYLLAAATLAVPTVACPACFLDFVTVEGVWVSGHLLEQRRALLSLFVGFNDLSGNFCFGFVGDSYNAHRIVLAVEDSYNVHHIVAVDCLCNWALFGYKWVVCNQNVFFVNIVHSNSVQ